MSGYKVSRHGYAVPKGAPFPKGAHESRRNALRSGAGFVRLREKNQPESRLVQTAQS